MIPSHRKHFVRAKVDELCLGIETLFADVPTKVSKTLDKMSKDRKLWSDDDEFLLSLPSGAYKGSALVLQYALIALPTSIRGSCNKESMLRP